MGKRGDCKGTRGNFLQLIEMFRVTIVVVLIRLYTFIKAHNIIQLKLVNCIVCKSYLSKNDTQISRLEDNYKSIIIFNKPH